MIEARILPIEEWPRLEAGAILPFVEPRNAALAVVEKDGRIIARQGVYATTYFEGLWVDPEYRGRPGIARALMREAFAIPRGRGEQWALTGANDDTMRGILARLGKRIPVDLYAIRVGG